MWSFMLRTWGGALHGGEAQVSAISAVSQVPGKDWEPHPCPGQSGEAPSALHAPCQGCAVKRGGLVLGPPGLCQDCWAVGVPAVPPQTPGLSSVPPRGSGPGSCQSIQGGPPSEGQEDGDA